MTRPQPEPTIKWALFSFRGRLGRASFGLGAVFLLLIQVAIFLEMFSYADESGRIHLEDGSALGFGLVLLGTWALSAWVLLAMTVKRLHDLNFPAILAVLILFPGTAFIALAIFGLMPGSQKTNKHGPPPFPRN